MVESDNAHMRIFSEMYGYLFRLIAIILDSDVEMACKIEVRSALIDFTLQLFFSH